MFGDFLLIAIAIFVTSIALFAVIIFILMRAPWRRLPRAGMEPLLFPRERRAWFCPGPGCGERNPAEAMFCRRCGESTALHQTNGFG